MRYPHFLFLLAAIGITSRSGATTEAAPPWALNAVSLESGLLWQVGRNTPLSYRLVPTQLSWRSPRKFGRTFADGTALVVRHRLTLLGTWFQQGPESHYAAFVGSPSIEWWTKHNTWCWFAGAGGGFGWLDSQAAPGAQGQDFTLNWMARAGVEHVLTARGSTARGTISAGVLFQHMSNGGQTRPNPGIDAVGFTAGYAWSF